MGHTNATNPNAEELGQILAILDQALEMPGVTVLKLRLVRYLLDADDSLDTFSDADIAGLLDCSERTAWEARRWVSQFFATMHVCSTQEISTVQNIHTSQLDPAVQLARQQLEAMDWGLLDGQRVQDIDAFIEQHGALNVLYAIWCSQGKRIENPPAFVTWWLRQGHEAPADWLPAELRTQEDPEPVPAAQPVPESTEAPETLAALQPLQAALLAYVEPQVRPASFQAWFEPLVLIDAEEADTLHLWAPSAAHAEWIQECYHQLLTKACQGVGYGNYRLIVGPDRKEVD